MAKLTEEQQSAVVDCLSFRMGLHGDGDKVMSEYHTSVKDENGNESLGYLNKMTIKRYYSILDKMGIRPIYLKEVPLRKIFSPLAKTKLFKEKFVKMVVTVIEK